MTPIMIGGENVAKQIDYASLFYRRADGRYMGHYRTKDGKRHAVYDRDPKALYEKIERLKKPEPITFRLIAEKWEREKFPELREGTISCYAPSLRRAIDLMGDRMATEVEPFDISNHLIRLRNQGFSAKTIKTQRTVYKLIYENAIIDEQLGRVIRSNPAVSVPLPGNLPKPEEREAPDDNIVKAIKDKATVEPFGLFALFLICTGFRRGEAMAVQWRDIDFGKMTISCHASVSTRSGVAIVGETKTVNAIRTVPLLPVLASALDPEGKQPYDYVFCGEDATRPLAPATYNRRWTSYCKNMGFYADGKVTLTAHCLRHGYATMLYEAGVDVYTAKRLMGHANIETTMAIYTHLRDKKDKESVDKLRAYTDKM